MATATDEDADLTTIETWEITTPSAVWVYRFDKRQRTYVQVKVGGANGPKRVRLTTDDRIYTSEQVLEENVRHDPFKNGVLVQVVKGKRVGKSLAVDDLRTMLEFDSIDSFREAVGAIDDELTIRRLRDVCEEHGTVRQLEVLTDAIDARFKVGGTQRSVRDMFDDDSERGETLH